MSYFVIPLVDSETNLFPEDTMDALRAALPGAAPDEIEAAVAAYLQANPPSAAEPLLAAHLADPTPHDAYDVDIPSLTLLFENGLA